MTNELTEKVAATLKVLFPMEGGQTYIRAANALIHDILPKKEIVIDKLGKWKCRNGVIATVTNLCATPYKNIPEFCIEGKSEVCEYYVWYKSGRYVNTGECEHDLVEFISPPEFTEEGLYKCRDGNTCEVIFSTHRNIRFTDPYTKRFYWNEFGRVTNYEERPQDLIRYLGKKPFEIDKPGVYEDSIGKKVFFPNLIKSHENTIRGFYIDISEWNYFYINGDCRLSQWQGITKFISPTWNFEKGAPV